MSKDPRKLTFEESGVTIEPLVNIQKGLSRCKEHDYERRSDNFNHVFYQCTRCSVK